MAGYAARVSEIAAQKPAIDLLQFIRDSSVFVLSYMGVGGTMVETRKIAAILAADVVGFSRMASADEDRTLAQLRALRADVIDPIIAAQNGRVFKRTGDGALIEFRSVVEAVRSAISVQNAMGERNLGSPEDQRIVFRIGIHLGDVVEESDGDLMGDGVNIAARLEGIAEPGGICLSEDAYRQVKGRLDIAVKDLGPIALKNIAEPVRAYALQVGVPAPRSSTRAKATEPKRRSMPTRLVAAIVALIILGGGVWYLLAGNRAASVIASNPPPAHLSIVVLPFNNLSGDPAQDYFADGVTDNLTTEISRIRDSFVIARNTAFTYKGKSVDAKEIGKQLGVRYVLEGSVQRDRNRVRANAQLIDTETGAHVWADRFEEDVADLFKLQDQVVARLANALNYELVRADAETNAHSKNPDAIDLDMRGTVALWRSQQHPTKESLLATRAMFEQALKIEPDDPVALNGSANTYLIEYAYGWANPDTDYEAKVLGQADRAIALAPIPWNYSAKVVWLTITGRANEALHVADTEIAINPNYAAAYSYRANAETFLRQYEQAKADLQQALRLSPRDPRTGAFLDKLGWAELGLEHYDAAIEASSKAIDAGSTVFFTYLCLATAHALRGDTDEAETALSEARRLNPKLSVKWMMGGKTFPSYTPQWYDALRKAGLPEE
jgi:adenylate cyclase